MTPSLYHLVEDHFRPEWWQFWRKQKYHVCQNYGSLVIYEVPDKCVITDKMHSARVAAHVVFNEVKPNCDDECPSIMASDPAFFAKLDEYLERGCYGESRMLKAEKLVSAMQGPIGPPGPSGPAGLLI